MASLASVLIKYLTIRAFKILERTLKIRATEEMATLLLLLPTPKVCVCACVSGENKNTRKKERKARPIKSPVPFRPGDLFPLPSFPPSLLPFYVVCSVFVELRRERERERAKSSQVRIVKSLLHGSKREEEEERNWDEDDCV